MKRHFGRVRRVLCPQARLVDLPFCRLRRGEGRRLASEASSFSPPVALEVSVERLDVALVLAEGVREIGVASQHALRLATVNGRS